MSLYDREGIENYERRAFYEQVEIEKEEIISCLKTVVRCWTENQIEYWNKPTYADFIHEYPEWRHAELYETVMTEMERTVKEEHEHKNFGLPFFSEASQV